jgi:hypothetical protein
VSKGSDIEVPPLSALKGTGWSRIKDSNKLDDVGIYSELCAGTNAEDLCLGTALNAKAEVCLEGGSAGLDSHGKRLAAESVA